MTPRRSGRRFAVAGAVLWRAGASAPCAVSVDAQTAWLGDRFVIPCGQDRLGVYDPATDTWQTVAAGPSPLNSRGGSAIAWTGTDLIVWSGIVDETGNPTPNSGSVITLGT